MSIDMSGDEIELLRSLQTIEIKSYTEWRMTDILRYRQNNGGGTVVKWWYSIKPLSLE